MGNYDASVNYIKHQCSIHLLFTDDNRLKPTHISLYMAMFQMWNLSRFYSPLLIIRTELMQMAKISSKSTYHRTIKELHDFRYIDYFPSRSPHIGSKIIMLTIDQITNTQKSDYRPKYEHDSPTGKLLMGHQSPNYELVRPKYGHDRPKNELQNEPLYKHINNNKHLNFDKPQNEFCEPIKEVKFEGDFSSKRSSNRSKFVPPNLSEVLEYFQEKSKPEIEAEKFFNYFESKGWKIGNNAPMKNWKAAANNWIINYEKFNLPKQNHPPSNLHVDSEKDYGIPL